MLFDLIIYLSYYDIYPEMKYIYYVMLTIRSNASMYNKNKFKNTRCSRFGKCLENVVTSWACFSNFGDFAYSVKTLLYVDLVCTLGISVFMQLEYSYTDINTQAIHSMNPLHKFGYMSKTVDTNYV